MLARGKHRLSRYAMLFITEIMPPRGSFSPEKVTIRPAEGA